MNKSTELLLTIAIPTFNRSKYLDRSLSHISEQLFNNNIDQQVEIIVSDNASTDDTTDTVNRYIDKGLKIRYFKNRRNEGSEYNVFQCYKEATGKFVLIFGDDDILINDAIHKILCLIRSEGEIGVVFLRAYGFITDYLSELPPFTNDGYVKYSESLDFIKKISYNVTFASSNVVNRSYFEKDKMIKYDGTNLMHAAITLDIILRCPNNIYVNEILLAGQADNSGGYNFFETFTNNLFKIYKEVVNEGIADMIMNKMIKEHFPYYILKLKKSEMANYDIDTSFLKNLSKKYTTYWIFNYPIFILPSYLANYYCIGIKVFNKFFSFFNRKKKIYKFLD